MVISRSIVRRWLAALAILASGGTPARAGFTITDLGVLLPPPSGTSAATAINASGVTAGMVTIQSGQGVETVAASSPSGTLQTVAAPSGATQSSATAINGGGTIAGNFSGPTVSQEGFYSSGSTATAIGFLNANGGTGTYTKANGINDSGQVVGTGNVPGGVGNRAFVLQGGSLVMIAPLGGGNPATSTLSNWANGINNAGTIVGTSEVVPGGLQEAFYTGTNNVAIALTGQANSKYTTGDFLGNTAGVAIDTNGDIVGNGDVGNSQHAFFAANTGGSLVDLGTLGGASSSKAAAVNDNQLVVGTSGGDAFLWGASEGMYDLDSLIPPGSNWVLTQATGINDSNQISGEGYLNGVLHGFLLTPVPGQGLFDSFSSVPEPPALMLSGMGLAIVWGWSRMQSRHGWNTRKHG